MRMIKISEAVWDAIAERGKFGETEDVVLRRVFGIEEVPEDIPRSRRGRGNVRYASKRMSARVASGHLIVEFEDGAREKWILPEDRADKAAIRMVREAAVAFALDEGASDPGQTNTVRKALTDAGYHLTK